MNTFSQSRHTPLIHFVQTSDTIDLGGEMESAETALKPLHGKSLLVVDDSQECLDLLRIRLSRAGAAVMTARGAREALRCAEESPFDAVLTDVEMPEIDGYSLIERLWTRGLNGPFIVVSSTVSDCGTTVKRSDLIAAQFCKTAETCEVIDVLCGLLAKSAGRSTSRDPVI